MVGGGLDFFTQVGHVDAEVVRVLIVAGAPDVAEELAVGDDFAAMLEEQAEQGVFFDGEVEIGAGGFGRE